VGKKVTTISGIVGLGTLLAGVGAPKVIESLPPWVNVALLAIGAALILGAFLSHLMTLRKEDADTGTSIRQKLEGDHGTQIANARDVHIHPPLAPAHPPIQAVARPIATRGSGRGEQIVRRRLAEEAKRCPEMPIWKAVEYVAGIIGDSYEKDDFAETRRQLRQAAADDRIEVWGKKDIPPAHMQDERHSAIWTPIEPTYWHAYELTPLATVDRYDDRDHTWLEELPSKRGNRYWSLRVREHQIKARWHEAKSAALKSNLPDLPLDGFIDRVYKALGGKLGHSPNPAFDHRVDLAILDAITEQGLRVWGRQGNSGRQQIPADVLKYASCNHRKGSITAHRGYASYSDLKFISAEVDRIWPKDPETTNVGRP